MPVPPAAVAISALLLIAAGIAFAGCLSAPDTPTIEITSPLDNQTIRPGDITVRANVNHFRSVDRQGEANAPGEGHIHFYMDVTPLPGWAGIPAVPADPNATWVDLASRRTPSTASGPARIPSPSSASTTTLRPSCRR